MIIAINKKDSILKQLQTIKQNTHDIKESCDDIKVQLKELFHDHLLQMTTLNHIKEYSRYLSAIKHRLDKIHLKKSNSEDINKLYRCQNNFSEMIALELENLNQEHTDNHQLGKDALFHIKPDFFDFSILLQEWRVSIFAQHLKTKVPVSYKRILKAQENLTRH